MSDRLSRLLAELAPQQSFELPVMGQPRTSEGRKRKKDTGHALYRPSRAMAEAEELLLEVTRRKAARSRCKHEGCQKLADKGLVWADGRAVVLCCNDHEKWARNTIEVKNKDEVVTVWDLVKERKAQGF